MAELRWILFEHPLSDIDVDIAVRFGDGEEVVLNDHLVWDVF